MMYINKICKDRIYILNYKNDKSKNKHLCILQNRYLNNTLISHYVSFDKNIILDESSNDIIYKMFLFDSNEKTYFDYDNEEYETNYFVQNEIYSRFRCKNGLLLIDSEFNLSLMWILEQFYKNVILFYHYTGIKMNTFMNFNSHIMNCSIMISEDKMITKINNVELTTSLCEDYNNINVNALCKIDAYNKTTLKYVNLD